MEFSLFYAMIILKKPLKKVGSASVSLTSVSKILENKGFSKIDAFLL